MSLFPVGILSDEIVCAHFPFALSPRFLRRLRTQTYQSFYLLKKHLRKYLCLKFDVVLPYVFEAFLGATIEKYVREATGSRVAAWAAIRKHLALWIAVVTMTKKMLKTTTTSNVFGGMTTRRPLSLRWPLK